MAERRHNARLAFEAVATHGGVDHLRANHFRFRRRRTDYSEHPGTQLHRLFGIATVRPRGIRIRAELCLLCLARVEIANQHQVAARLVHPREQRWICFFART